MGPRAIHTISVSLGSWNSRRFVGGRHSGLMSCAVDICTDLRLALTMCPFLSIARMTLTDQHRKSSNSNCLANSRIGPSRPLRAVSVDVCTDTRASNNCYRIMNIEGTVEPSVASLPFPAMVLRFCSGPQKSGFPATSPKAKSLKINGTEVMTTNAAPWSG